MRSWSSGASVCSELAWDPAETEELVGEDEAGCAVVDIGPAFYPESARKSHGTDCRAAAWSFEPGRVTLEVRCGAISS